MLVRFVGHLEGLEEWLVSIVRIMLLVFFQMCGGYQHLRYE